MSVYLVLKFSSGLKNFKREEKKIGDDLRPVVLAHKKQRLTLKKSVKLFEKIVT